MADADSSVQPRSAGHHSLLAGAWTRRDHHVRRHGGRVIALAIVYSSSSSSSSGGRQQCCGKWCQRRPSLRTAAAAAAATGGRQPGGQCEQASSQQSPLYHEAHRLVYIHTAATIVVAISFTRFLLFFLLTHTLTTVREPFISFFFLPVVHYHCSICLSITTL